MLTQVQSEHLANYLAFMQECGISEVRVEESPFFYANPKGQEPHVVSAKQAKQLYTPKPKAAPVPSQAKLGFNANEILNLTKIDIEDDVTSMKTRAQNVSGDSPEEILRGLYQTFHKCSQCGLHRERNHFVFGEGPSQAKLMFVGEGPGFDEDRTGRPFVGKAGQLLEKIILAMGYQRGEVFIGNIVKCRPPNNRTPLPEEMKICSPILERQIQAIQPKIIVALGKTALSYFKQEHVSIMRLRGQFFSWENIQIMPTYHPAYTLRNPASKRDVWEDMKKVMAVLNPEKEGL